MQTVHESSADRLVRLAALRRRLPASPRRRAIREAAGQSVQGIAKAVGVTRQTVHFWEAGTREPRDENLEAYVDLLDRLAAICEGDGEQS